MVFNLVFIITVIIIKTDHLMEIVIGNLIDFTIMINVTIIMKITIDIIMEIIMKSSLIGVFYEFRVGAHVLVFSGFPWHSLFFWV